MDTAPLPLFSFDRNELQRLQSALPADLQLLRLRLRFGLPVRVQLGQRFRVVVDIVDEVGQPFPKHFAPPEGVDIALTSGDSGNQESGSMDSDDLTLEIEEQVSPAAADRQTKWLFWASVQGSTSSVIDACVSLSIMMKQTAALGGDPTMNDHRRLLLQTFCVGSAWLNERVLVLPLQVQLQVTNARDSSASSLTSTFCQRLFRSTPSKVSATGRPTDEGGLLIVEEHYGDAMGAHVWDASILLSWAMLHASTRAPTSPGQADPADSNQTMLELGSGCGLFAAVLARFQCSHQHVKAVFTEKPECTGRLQKNLDRNGSPPSASVLALEWGTPLPSPLRGANVRVVFAADVLYNWAAHEVFLDTLDQLAESDAKLEVLVAHKRRGKASAERLDALASDTFDPAAHCVISSDKAGCRWTQWRVDKLASLGRVDLFQVSRR